MTHTIRQLNKKGDTPFSYEPEVDEQVSLAEAFFKEKVKEVSSLAFGIDENGKATMIREFDEKYPEIVIAPQLVGG